jgi:hypothetical protein
MSSLAKLPPSEHRLCLSSHEHGTRRHVQLHSRLTLVSGVQVKTTAPKKYCVKPSAVRLAAWRSPAPLAPQGGAVCLRGKPTASYMTRFVSPHAFFQVYCKQPRRSPARHSVHDHI